MLGSTGRTYEDFCRQVPPAALPLYDRIRDHCLSMDRAVEDVRMHRTVFAKSMAFRWFADVSPEGGQLQVKLQRGRREPPQVVCVAGEQDLAGALEQITEAYRSLG